MTSNDKQEYITVEMFNGGIQEIKSELKDIKTEIRFINARIDNTLERIDGVKSSTNTGFTTLGIIIGLVGLIIAVLGVFKKEKKTEMSERDLRAMMREEIRMAQNVAVVGK